MLGPLFPPTWSFEASEVCKHETGKRPSQDVGTVSQVVWARTEKGKHHLALHMYTYIHMFIRVYVYM